MTKSERVQAFQSINIYPVTCQELSNGRTDEEILDGIIRGGAKIVQLRDKNSNKRELFEKAKRFREDTLKSDLLLIINDHLDIAMAVDADGVHLGQTDIPISDAKRLAPGTNYWCLDPFTATGSRSAAVWCGLH